MFYMLAAIFALIIAIMSTGCTIEKLNLINIEPGGRLLVPQPQSTSPGLKCAEGLIAPDCVDPE